MITNFRKFLNESIFSDEIMDDLYLGGDDTDFYNWGDDKENRLVHKKTKNNRGTYTLAYLKGLLTMVTKYIEYYNLIKKIINLMNDNNWSKITVPNNLDSKLAKVPNIGKINEIELLKLLKSLKTVSLKEITSY